MRRRAPGHRSRPATPAALLAARYRAKPLSVTTGEQTGMTTPQPSWSTGVVVGHKLASRSRFLGKRRATLTVGAFLFPPRGQGTAFSITSTGLASRARCRTNCG